MKNTLVKCIPARHYQDLTSGHYRDQKVGVYYSFDTKQSDFAHIAKLAEAVQNELPELPIDAMEIQCVTYAQSFHHTKQTMIRAYVDTNKVKANIKDYVVL
jgi:hypothetical protein